MGSQPIPDIAIEEDVQPIRIQDNGVSKGSISVKEDWILVIIEDMTDEIELYDRDDATVDQIVEKYESEYEVSQ